MSRSFPFEKRESNAYLNTRRVNTLIYFPLQQSVTTPRVASLVPVLLDTYENVSTRPSTS